MELWAIRRRWTYIFSFAVLFLILVGFFYYNYIYKAPTCFDGKMNGDEVGIDCGGGCVLLCKNQNIEPIVHWARPFQIGDSLYSLLAYVENPNFTAGTRNIPYTFNVYDADNKNIFSQKGNTFIPVGTIFGIFEGPIDFGTAIPQRVTFEFGTSSVWERGVRSDGDLKATRIRLTREQPTPRVDASLENKSLKDIRNVEAVAIVYNDNNNAFAVSRTFADNIPAERSVDIAFTWPRPFVEQFAHCAVPADVVLAIDRSGSMADDNKNPPEPLTSVKIAAETFVDALGGDGRIAIVSFATTATKDQGFMSSSVSIKNSLKRISIGTNGLQQTNIGDALGVARDVLLTASSSVETQRVIILLTDGVPTHPLDQTSNKDKDYPKKYASERAMELKGDGIILYTIGLGKAIDEDFLRSIAAPSRFYRAPTSNDLVSIYKAIGASLCKRNPIIEILPRIYPAK